MVAYSFNPRFETPILSGTKSGTIRAVGHRRHARAGETVQLYVGQRTRHCRLLGAAFCTSVDPIQIIVGHWLGRPKIEAIDIGRERGPSIFDRSLLVRGEIDDFAKSDGFIDGDEMAKFWWTTHSNLIASAMIQFAGVWVRWAPLGSPA